ncbi:MAG: four helix bundle protein [Candidatus Uhrbacteria bacterium]|nr:four helix bundle protein [Candidatus Uhrbacteria bacterium]MDP3793840.1 four helix bundle protein [Candidatus Uhrbacteria bacterium]
MNTYKDLKVWQKAIDLVVAVYQLTDGFPREEIYGLTSQMRRAAVSIPSNIAEGKLRGHQKEFRQFLFIAYGSGAELETQIEIAKRLSHTNQLSYDPTSILLTEVMKMLNVMLSQFGSLKPNA